MTTHDEGDLWAGKAPHGWERCAGCGEEWGRGDPSSCTCGLEEDDWKVQPQVKRRSGTGMDGAVIKPGINVLAQVSPALKEKVRRAAEDAGISVSEWLRRAIVKELECG